MNTKEFLIKNKVDTRYVETFCNKNGWGKINLEDLLNSFIEHYKQNQALQLQQTGVKQSVLFANWIVEKGYKLNNKPFIKGRDAVWFFDKKSFGLTTSELYKQYLSETVA